MMKDKYENMLGQFKLYYPGLYEQGVDWWPSGRYYITIKLSDGLLFEFNSLDNSIRKVKSTEHTGDLDTLKKDIGYNIQKVIQSRSIPQNDVATKSGITQAMLSRYIHGKSMPSLDKLYAMANTLGCRLADLLGELEEE